MVEETGVRSTLDATLLADAETLVQTAGGTIIDDDPALDVDRGSVVGRYTILDRLGSGAMGVVYTAYDPKLDRRIALKLLRIPGDDNGTQIVARLIREAQALAKLSHPNVVTIHDCDTLGDMVYLAMELVEGQTLTRWLRAAARTPEEILRAFIQAGRGLAAAHEVGLVHRDFKPDNVLIGNEGRVRVADFGIARNADEDPLDGPSAVGRVLAAQEPILSSAEISTARLTQTGAVVGTPAYMAPEQHLGTRVDPRCDQFAFCVALYEALYGTHPFPAKGYLELRQQVLTGKLQPTPARGDIPPAVRAALLRGLSVLPDQRFPSMAHLLEAIAQDPARRRQRLRTLGIAAALVAAAVGATAYTLRSARSACEGAERHLAGIWDAPARGAAEAAFQATRLPYADKAWETSAAAVDRFAGAWVAMRTEACEATAIYHEQSTELLDRRMACLDRRLRRLAATARLFREADADVVLRAVSAAEDLGGVQECADTEQLLREEAPASPGERADFERADELLAQAAALRSAGRFRDSLRVAEEAEALAERLGSRPLRARALRARAGAEDELARPETAAGLLAEAAALAEEAGDDELRGEIWSELGLIEGVALERPGEAERRLQHTAAIFARADASRLRRAHLESRLGAVLTSAGRYDDALVALGHALAELREVTGEYSTIRMSTLNVLGSVHDLRGDLDAALTAYSEALAIAEHQVGPDHPDTAKVLNNLAIIHKRRGEQSEALAHYQRALGIRRRVYGPNHPDVAQSMSNLGNLYAAMDRHDDAITHLEAALQINLATRSPSSREIGRVLYNIGLAHHLARRYREAAEYYRRALPITEAAYGPDHAEVAFPLAALGGALVELGDLEGARAPLERALAIRTREGVEPVDIGEIRFALARALPPERRAEALGLARAARDDYAALGDEQTIAAIDDWLRNHREG